MDKPVKGDRSDKRQVGSGEADDTALAGRRCLILGGGGFIGINLCNALVKVGALVQGFGRPSAWPSSVPADVMMTHGEFSDPVALAKAVEGQDYIFHLLGSLNPASSNFDPAAEFGSGLLNTVRLLDIARSGGTHKVIFVSSGGTIYGPNQSVPIPEVAPTDPISAYGINKLAIEKCLALYRHLHGLDYQILRVANPYGRYQSPSKKQGIVATIIDRALRDIPIEIWGTGETIRDFIHVDDVVAALIMSVGHNGPHRCFNVGSGVGRSVNQVLESVERVMGRGELRVVYKSGRDADVPINVLDTTRITEEMGWRPVRPWLESLQETVDWMTSQPGMPK